MYNKHYFYCINIELKSSSNTTVESCYTAKIHACWQQTQHLFPITLHSSLTTQLKKPRMPCCSHMSVPVTITRLLIQSFFGRLLFRMRTTEPCIKLPFLYTLLYMVYTLPVKSLHTTSYTYFLTFERNSKVLKIMK